VVIGMPYDDFTQIPVVTLALQTLSASGWKDYATVQRVASATPSLIELTANIAPGSEVRLQIRATGLCFIQFDQVYDLRSARIQVETCVPDQTNPGSCL
jgi:hypothetical protein